MAEQGVEATVCTHFAEGSKGAIDLANAMVKLIDEKPGKLNFVYEDQDTLWQKLNKTRDCKNTYLNFDPAEGAPLNDLIGHSITYRVAVGPRTGQKVFTLRSLSAQRDDDGRKGVAEYAGFSVHAGIGIEADARETRERLCRYVSRPAIAAERLTLTPQGDVHFRLKTPYRDGITHVIFEPEDFIARLVALVPKPRAHRAGEAGTVPGRAENARRRGKVQQARPSGYVHSHGSGGHRPLAADLREGRHGPVSASAPHPVTTCP